MIFERENIKGYKSLIQVDEQELHDLFDSLEYGDTIPIDTETTGIDPYIESVLLVSFKIKERVFVIDWTKTQFDFEYYSKKYDLIWLAHNAKFDGKMLQASGVTLEYWYCTMNCDQKIYQGVNFIKYGLNDLKLRHLNIHPEIHKGIRLNFIGRNPQAFEPTNSELLYACDDVDYLQDIMSKQISSLEQSNPSLLQFILTDGLGAMRANIDIELEGYDFDIKGWRDNIKVNETYKNKIQEDIEKHLKDNYPDIDMGNFDPKRRKNLDNYTKQIEKIGARINTHEAKITDLALSNKTHQQQYHNALEALEKANNKLEDYKHKLVIEEESGCLNFKSVVQIRDLFTAIEVAPLPIKKDKSTGREGVSIDKNVLREWLAENEGNKHSFLMDLLSKYSKTSHAISSFGENYVNYVNPVTGRMHTIYRDEGSETGRYTCGDKNYGYPNFQQIPADDNYRNCFYKKNHHFCIVDWSGAELTIMISLANDWTLKKIADDTRDSNGDPDLHSHFATICWRGIYSHRLAVEQNKPNPDPVKVKELTELSKLTVGKGTEFEHLRKAFKGITFK